MSLETTFLNYSGVTGAKLASKLLTIARAAQGVAKADRDLALADSTRTREACNAFGSAIYDTERAVHVVKANYFDVSKRDAYHAVLAAHNAAVRDFAHANAAYIAADAAAFAAADALVAARSTVFAVKNNAAFFKPFKSTSAAFFSVSSIISAPVFLSLLAVKEVLSFIVSGLGSLVHLAMLDSASAKASFNKSSYSLLKSVELLLAAVVSPFVNSVDFLGSTVTSLMPAPEPEPEPEPAADEDGAGYALVS